MFYSIWTNYLPDRPTFGWQPCYWLLKQPFLWGEVLSCYPNMHFHSLRLLRRTLNLSFLRYTESVLIKQIHEYSFTFPRGHTDTHTVHMSAAGAVSHGMTDYIIFLHRYFSLHKYFMWALKQVVKKIYLCWQLTQLIFPKLHLAFCLFCVTQCVVSV